MGGERGMERSGGPRGLGGRGRLTDRWGQSQRAYNYGTALPRSANLRKVQWNDGHGFALCGPTDTQRVLNHGLQRIKTDRTVTWHQRCRNPVALRS